MTIPRSRKISKAPPRTVHTVYVKWFRTPTSIGKSKHRIRIKKNRKQEILATWRGEERSRTRQIPIQCRSELPAVLLLTGRTTRHLCLNWIFHRGPLWRMSIMAAYYGVNACFELAMLQRTLKRSKSDRFFGGLQMYCWIQKRESRNLIISLIHE